MSNPCNIWDNFLLDEIPGSFGNFRIDDDEIEI